MPNLKTAVSRFSIHDELSVPDETARLFKGVLSQARAFSNLLRVLSGSTVALRSYLRLRSELADGHLDRLTRERISLGVAEHRGDTYSVLEHARLARAAGLGLDEITAARSFNSVDEQQLALLRFCAAALTSDGATPAHLHEEAREIGWSDEQLLEALTQVALIDFQCIVANSSGLPREDVDKRSVLPVAA